MLNLRDKTSPAQTQSTIQASTIRFNADMVVGNMGQSLRFGPDDDEVEDDNYADQEPVNETE